MNRSDWIVIGIRLIGIYTFAQGVVGLPMAFLFDPSLSGVWRTLAAFAVPLSGAALAVFAVRLEAWLDHLDRTWRVLATERNDSSEAGD